MNRKLVYCFVALVMVFALDGCRGKKEMVKKDKTVTLGDELIQKVSKQGIGYENIEIKFSTRAVIEDKNYSLNITYRNTKDETIWISVRAMLGIEAARVIATRDSVWVISKIAQIKEKGTWKEMSKTIGYPLNFDALQSIMSRKIFYPGTNDLSILNSFLVRDNGKNTVLLVPDFKKQRQINDVDSYGFLPQFIVDKGSGGLNGTRLVPRENEWMFEVKYQVDSDDNMGLGNSMVLKAVDTDSNLDMELKIQQLTINQSLKFPFQWF